VIQIQKLWHHQRQSNTQLLRASQRISNESISEWDDLVYLWTSDSFIPHWTPEPLFNRSRLPQLGIPLVIAENLTCKGLESDAELLSAFAILLKLCTCGRKNFLWQHSTKSFSEIWCLRVCRQRSNQRTWFCLPNCLEVVTSSLQSWFKTFESSWNVIKRTKGDTKSVIMSLKSMNRANVRDIKAWNTKSMKKMRRIICTSEAKNGRVITTRIQKSTRC
jgi:hypothetical protein